MPDVSDHEGEIDGLPVFWRSAPVSDAAGEQEVGGALGHPGSRTGTQSVGRAGGQSVSRAVPLYLHGVPSNSDDWLAFLQRGGGLAPDLPGFGRSGKPGSLRYTIAEYDRFIERFVDHLGVDRVQLVVHDWGAVGLAFAQRLPGRVERIVIINAVPMLPGFRWHRLARAWRTPGLGELAMGTTSRFALRLASRQANATEGPMPEEWLDSVLAHFDQGTQRAILRLYRSSPPGVLAAAGEGLGSLQMPALVLWGMQDPYIPARFARAYADVLPRAELIELPDAGHTPWLDRPEVLERVVDFLSAG